MLNCGQLTLADIQNYIKGSEALALPEQAYQAIDAAKHTIDEILASGQTVYGVNTGFGLLANQTISNDQLNELQTNLIVSHAAGVGELLSDDIVKTILLLKINSLAQGHSGVSRQVVDGLLKFYNTGLYPCIPSQGSVGASGDLAPLAHLSLPLIGEGEVRYRGEVMDAKQGLAAINMQPLTLQPKEGLALINGTQVSTAIAINAWCKVQRLFNHAVLAGAMSVDAAGGCDTPFDPRIHQVRRQQGQQQVAAMYEGLMAGSQLRHSHKECTKVQDPYSLRCQPQVMGACLEHIQFAQQVFTREANGVSDNPLIFADGDILSGGNFHAEPVAMAADTLALAIAEIGALSERRIALLIDGNMTGLPHFLVDKGGLNSGFMIAHVTAAALASENKSLAHPASVDSLPTSANQEDHVSMATYAAKRLHKMAENVQNIISIEFLAAAQGIEMRGPTPSSPALMAVLAKIREKIPFYAQDCLFSPDINHLFQLIAEDSFAEFMPNTI